MSVIRDGDSGDKVVAVLRERAFNVEDDRLSQRASPDAIRRMRDRGVDIANPHYHYIMGDRVVDACGFLDKRVIVEVQLDADDRVTYLQVEEKGEGP